MGLALLEPVKKSQGQKGAFMERMKLISDKTQGIKSTYISEGKYTQWQLFVDYIVVRCYDKHLTIHVHGDIDHYEVKSCTYNEVQFECNDLDFISRLLRIKHE